MLIGKIPNIIPARKCKIVALTSEQECKFFNTTHIQGYKASSSCYALTYEETIVCAISFIKSRFNKQYQYELLRFSNALNATVIGGASKLFKYFIKTHNPNSIITYSDKRWNTGQLYTTLGFKYLHTSAPNYFYFSKNNVLNLQSRQTYQKHKLPKVLNQFDISVSEWENMQLNGYDRIWDCGNAVYGWESI